MFGWNQSFHACANSAYDMAQGCRAKQRSSFDLFFLKKINKLTQDACMIVKLTNSFWYRTDPIRTRQELRGATGVEL